MMVPVADEEDDFIVQNAAAAEEAPGTPQEDVLGWRQYGLKKLGGLVFAKGAEEVAEPEPTLPAGFSATLNAEEEEIYPAEVRGACKRRSDELNFFIVHIIRLMRYRLWAAGWVYVEFHSLSALVCGGSGEQK